MAEHADSSAIATASANELAHAPLPWRHGHRRVSVGAYIGLRHQLIDAKGKEIDLLEHVDWSGRTSPVLGESVFPVYTGHEDADFPVQPNNAFVLLAVNSHYDLISELRAALREIERLDENRGYVASPNTNRRIKAAIDKAEGR